ncbi:ABC transporter substrate-binding protein [Pelatocladus sp. BLCC-F211]|uniref:ABC transporter substrate-binding protein n=1 Tax=Pelatocladus sp. BLCC-F211 TaxID=3342752 RepID=UPI0035BAF04B
MSENNNKPPLLIKLLAFMAGVIVVFSGAYLKYVLQGTPENSPPSPPIQTTNTPEPISDEVKNRISVGDKIFSQYNKVSDYIKIQNLASLKMKEKQYNEAYDNFNKLRDEYKTTGSNECADPETLIYKNNALIGNDQAYTIAVVVPIENSADRALETLRGVAQAQEEFNHESENINGKKLRVIIANEKDNDLKSTEIIAQTLGISKDILGVIGHSSSDATEVAAPIYRNHKLVSISPTSTKVNIADNNQYFFRIAHDNQAEARALSNYMLRNLQQKKASILFNSSSVFSRSLRDEFAKAVGNNQGQIHKKYDLDDNSLKGSRILSDSNTNNVSVFMFAASSKYLQDIAIKIYKPGFQKFYYLGGDATYNPKLLTEDVGERLRKIVIAIPWHYTINSKESQKFVTDSYKLWCQPENSEDKIIWRTATAYDATKLVIEALKHNPSREGVKDFLSTLKKGFSYDEGVTGEIKFKPNGDRAGESKLVQMVEDENSPEKYVFKCIQGCEGK